MSDPTPDYAGIVHDSVLISLTDTYQRNTLATSADYAGDIVRQLLEEYPQLAEQVTAR